MRLADIAEAWEQVGATRSRSAKTSQLAAVLARLPDDEVASGTAMLAGEPRQGRVGVGWRTIGEVDVAPATSPSLTLDDVDDAIEAVAAEAGPGSQARREDLLRDLFGRATATEQAFLRGLLLGELRQGALEGVVMAAVAEAADVAPEAVRRAAMLTGDVTEAAVLAMTEGRSCLQAVRLQVGRPVQPMLARSAPDVAAALQATGPAAVETRLDGMRVQVHRHGDDVSVVTRSLREVTADLPAVVRAARDLPADRFVLDGEALAIDGRGRPRAFQDTMQTVGEDTLQPWFFDLLHVDGTDLLDDPLERRLGALDAGTGEAVMLGKTFKGLTDELLTWQTSALLERETSREGHVVHVRPDLVVEVAIDGVQRSSRYPAGMALRFARVRRYRPDKDPAQADTVETCVTSTAATVCPGSPRPRAVEPCRSATRAPSRCALAVRPGARRCKQHPRPWYSWIHKR